LKSRIKTLTYKSISSNLLLALLVTFAATVPSFAVTDDQTSHAGHAAAAVPATLVQIVRNVTAQFIDVNAAGPAGYQPLFGCISGPDHGAMGVHYINLNLVGDGEVNSSKPEALIYEPWHGGYRLVGVEYIVDAATWSSNHDAPPMLEGQAFQFVNSPNRYGLAAFYELHVWAWRDNPNGAFVDWNNWVTCEGQ
jgi:hypothetical protein